MKIVYIAGPYSSENFAEFAANIGIAEKHARNIATAGFGFICPHLNSRNMHDIQDYAFWTKMYFELLKLCDAIYMLPNWERSHGARAEKSLAEREQIPVFYGLDKLLKWAKARRS